MANDREKQRTETDSEIEREIREGRKLTAKDLMARLAGPGAMKGASPVSPVQQAENEIGSWLGNNLQDDCGQLRVVLHRNLKGSECLLENLDQPLTAIEEYLRRLLATDNLLKEIVREADVEWGRVMDERPHFEREGAAANPDDPYTCIGVRKTLGDALERLPHATK
ncbi:hypothetical protein LZ496_02835 [Sphingomonas sp. NSE70-1]|uniref:Uncharacterized protein n=1 Tax=Sphingomonas caseinilyticus TaxID=2908205 RepID=A0ABT0RRT7_9SPHN|nr:hypothetical protein [Sphingomonas caseinilyticus]MCL6697719.1 hypothetical protein [Sphingomonas caseinilyticus]